MKNKRIIIEGKETYYLIYENGEVYSEYASKFLKPCLVRGYLGKQKTSYGFKWEYKDGRKDMKWNGL